MLFVCVQLLAYLSIHKISYMTLVTLLFTVCVFVRLSQNVGSLKSTGKFYTVNIICYPHGRSNKFTCESSSPFGREEKGRGGLVCPCPSASCWCVAPQQLLATLTMASAASRTLLTLFVAFCTLGCGWTGKNKYIFIKYIY